MSERTYYIVEVTCREVKAYNGNILTPENQIAYLGWSSEYGYPSVSTGKSSAKHFDKPPSKSTIAQWDGMPWYYQIKSARIIPVRELKIYETEEMEPIIVK